MHREGTSTYKLNRLRFYAFYNIRHQNVTLPVFTS